MKVQKVKFNVIFLVFIYLHVKHEFESFTKQYVVPRINVDAYKIFRFITYWKKIFACL